MSSNKKDTSRSADEIFAAAYDATMTVLRDETAPPTARASASATAVKIYEIKKTQEPSTKEQFEMTYDDLQANIARLQSEQNARSPSAAESVLDGDVESGEGADTATDIGDDEAEDQ